MFGEVVLLREVTLLHLFMAVGGAEHLEGLNSLRRVEGDLVALVEALAGEVGLAGRGPLFLMANYFARYSSKRPHSSC